VLLLAAATSLTGSPTQAQGPGDSVIYLPIIMKEWPMYYSIVPVGETEHRFICNGHHFLTLIEDQGAFVFRPHPGVDENGWGSSWYAQPFLPGAVLSRTVVESLEAEHNKGIKVVASGQVSRGTSSTYGPWTMTIQFACSRLDKRVTGVGQYTIDLAGDLTYSTGDLNLYKIASNYLYDIPLLSGGQGNTGDMEKVNYIRDDGGVVVWVPNPASPGHYPNDTADKLSVDVIGQYNNADTWALGESFCMKPAFKPSLRVDLTSQQAGARLTFGAFYTTAYSQAFWADNVAVTPLIRQPRSQQAFHFDVEFESKALDGDGTHPDICPDAR